MLARFCGPTWEMLAEGEKPLVVTIGYLTAEQHAAINEHRAKQRLPELGSPEVVFLGRHLYKSRAVTDGYSIDDILDQIESAMSATSMVIATHKMTALKNKTARGDRYGNQVCDEAVFELTQRRPKARRFQWSPRATRTSHRAYKDERAVLAESPFGSSPG